MATVINNPGDSDGGSGAGLIVGILFGIIVIALFFLYALPAIRGADTAKQPNSIDVNVKLPEGNTNSGNTNTSGGTTGGTPPAGTQ